MSGSLPIPADKPDIAAATAIAGHCLGMQCMYLDTGSGADQAVPADMIAAVRRAVPPHHRGRRPPDARRRDGRLGGRSRPRRGGIGHRARPGLPPSLRRLGVCAASA